MFMTRCTSKTEHSQAVGSPTRHGIYNVMLGTSIAIASAALLTGCGQKGDLYLVESGKAVRDSTAILDSGSNPQDAAFAKIDGNQQNNEQDTDDFQLPEPSSDLNDY
jgi:predicted small lipoprotein YifL